MIMPIEQIRAASEAINNEDWSHPAVEQLVFITPEYVNQFVDAVKTADLGMPVKCYSVTDLPDEVGCYAISGETKITVLINDKYLPGEQ